MTLDDYRDYLAHAFPKAVKQGIRHRDHEAAFIRELFEPARRHHESWGFESQGDCFQAAVPRSNHPTLEAFSEGEIKFQHWKLKASCTCFIYGLNYVHIEVRNVGNAPLPFTETGYKSFFVPLPSFENGKTVIDFLEAQFPKEPQLSLF